MTESEIMKAFDCCLKNDISCDYCEVCPYLAMGSMCMDNLMRDVIDLINRKNAENERLSKEKENLTTTYIQVCNSWHNTTIGLQAMRDRALKAEAEIETARAEAIKEVLERVKEKQYLDGVYVVDVNVIDQISKEMGVEL